MRNQIGSQFWIEQPDGEAHNHSDEGCPYRRSYENLFERMTWGEVDDAGAADDVGEDEDEGYGGQEQCLRTFARIAQSLGDDDGDEEVERRRQNLRSKGI